MLVKKEIETILLKKLIYCLILVFLDNNKNQLLLHLLYAYI